MENTPSRLISAYGGELVQSVVPADKQKELKAGARDWASWDLTPRQLCDLELLLNGAFFTSLALFTLVFFALLWIRFNLERSRNRLDDLIVTMAEQE